MTQAGGPAAINGFLYQIIHHLEWLADVTLSGKLAGQDIENACLVLEPRCGGDAHADAPGIYLVEQYKTRKNGTWSVTAIESVLRDLRKAVRLARPKNALYRFVTDGRAGKLDAFNTFLIDVKSASGPDDLDISNRKYFDCVVEKTRSKSSQVDADERAIVFHLLCRFDMKFSVDADTSAARIEKFFRPIASDLGDERKIREHLVGVLVEELSKGEVHLDAARIDAIFRHAGLSPERLINLTKLPDKMCDLTRNRLSRFKYQSDWDVRSVPEWPENKPVLLIAGESGSGKTWQLARLLEAYGEARQLVTLVSAAKSTEELLSRAARDLWQIGLNETSEKSIDSVSNFLRALSPDVAIPRVVIAFDDIQNVNLIRDFVRQDWVNWGMRLALTVPRAAARSLQLSDEDAIHVHYVSNFSVNELDTLLKKNGQKWADFPADLKKLLRNPILAGLFLKLPYTSIQNALHSEYEIFENFWLRIVEKGQPGDGGIVTALATQMHQGKSYPLPRTDWHEIGLDGEVLARLDAASWLHCTEDGEVAFAHDRLLNWAVAKSLVHQFQNNKLSAADLGYFLAGKGGDEDRHVRRRLNYVPMDTLWLLAENEQNSKILGQLITQLEDNREFGSYGEDLYTCLLPTLGQRAVPILLERLNVILGNSNVDYRASLIGKSFTKLAQQENIDLNKTIDSLLNTPHLNQQKIAIAALTVAPDIYHLDRLWELHQQFLTAWKAATSNLSHVHYQDSFAALRAGIALDPEWLRDRILSADANMEPVSELGYQLNTLEYVAASAIWKETRDVLMEKIPANKSRSFLYCVARFSDHEKKDYVIRNLSCSEDLIGSAALSALSVLDPSAAIEYLVKVPEYERYLTRNQWLPVLLRVKPELMRQRILELAKIDSRGHRLIEELFSERPDEIDVAMLQFVLYSLEEELQKHLNADTKDEPNWLSRSLDFLGRIIHPELLSILEAKANSELEQKIVDIACSRLHSNSRTFDSLREGARRFLILMGGDAVTTLIKQELDSEHFWVRHSGLNWAFVCNDDGIAKRLGEIVRRPVARDANGKPESEPYQEFFQAMIALSAVGNDETLIEALKHNGMTEVPTDLAKLRVHRGPMPKVLTDQALQTLENSESSESELLNALIVAWLSNDVDLIPAVRAVLIKANLECRVASYACIALQALGDSSDDFRSLAERLIHTKENSIWGINALLNLGTRGLELIGDLLKVQVATKSIDHEDQVIRALYDNPTTRKISIDAAVSHCDRVHSFSDSLYDIAAEANNPTLREEILDKAFTTNSDMQQQSFRAMEGLAKFDIMRAVEAIELGLHSHPAIERQLCQLLVRIAPETAAEKLIDAAISTQRDSLKRATGRALRRIESEIVSCLVIERMTGLAPERKIIAELAGWLPIPAIANALCHLADNDNDSEVRHAALVAIENHRLEINVKALFAAFPSAVFERRWSILVAILDAADPYLLSDHEDPLWLGNIISEDMPAIFAHHANSVLRRRQQKEK